LAPGAASAQTSESVEGYAEWKTNDTLYVDGQRITITADTKFKGKGIRGLGDIPLGHEVKAKGRRQPTGDITAKEVEAQRNGVAAFETDVLKATNEIEQVWLADGHMFDPGSDGERNEVGRILKSGPDVERVRGIMLRLLPPYVKPEDVRAYVVDTKVWNAAAMGNGAIWVNTGLLHAATDDEMAVVLGHELAHYTHEHSRRGQKRSFFGEMVKLGAQAAITQIDSVANQQTAALATALGVGAWVNGYSRSLEDQADRVGLRYAFEGGFDVTVGPGLWDRFREKYGENDQVTNFFQGSHSRPTDRIKNLGREIERNYGPNAERQILAP
jgi:hypothetical protein